MHIETAREILRDNPGNINIINPVKFWEDIENEFLKNHYEQKFLVKTIVIKKKTKHGSKEYPYIYYYEIVRRDEFDEQNRKDTGKINNLYTKHEYIGKVDDFERQYNDSLMNALVREGKIGYEKGKMVTHTRVIEVLLAKYPDLIYTHTLQTLLNQVEEETTYDTTI